MPLRPGAVTHLLICFLWPLGCLEMLPAQGKMPEDDFFQKVWEKRDLVEKEVENRMLVPGGATLSHQISHCGVDGIWLTILIPLQTGG